MMSFWPFLLLQLVIFVALVVILRRILGRNLIEGAARLQGLSAEYAQRQDDLKQQLVQSEKQYADELGRAKSQAEQLLAASRQDADTAKTRILDEARQEGERIVQQAIESREALRKEIEQRMEARAVDHACALIRQVLPQPLRQAIHALWLDELMQHGLNRLEQVRAEADLRQAGVATAFPLSAEQRARLRQQLRAKLGRDIEVAERTDDGLVAGLTISLGSLVLDGSLSSRLQQAARAVRDGQGSG